MQLCVRGPPVARAMPGCGPISVVSFYFCSFLLTGPHVFSGQETLSWRVSVITLRFMSPMQFLWRGETRPFHFMTPKCIFLTAYFLEHLNNSSDGAHKPLGDTEIMAGGTQSLAILLFPILVDTRSFNSKRKRANIFQFRIHQGISESISR